MAAPFQYFMEPENPALARGPAHWAEALWIEEMPYEIRKQKAHLHWLDVAICVASVASGKSMNTAARGMHVMRKWKNSRAIIGAMDYPQLEKAQMNHWAALYGMNGNGEPWGHKSIKRKPTDKRRWVELDNGGIVYFSNLTMWQSVKSIPAGFILVEEANNIPSSQSYFELQGRFRCQSMPLYQMVLLANPRLQGNWMYDTFNLKQYSPTYKGEIKPIGKPCTCQFCPTCKNADKIEVEWVDNECPRCGIENDRPRQIQYCRNCKATKRKLVKADGIFCPECGWINCPGEQNFHRYIPSNILMNQFADPGQIENMRATMSPLQFQLLAEGKILDANTGNIHVSWSDGDTEERISNILPDNVDMDYSRDIHWCQDFNNDPMTTVLAQVYENNGGHLVLVKDEILCARSTVQDNVKVFVDRYGDYKGKVIVWGDPSGFNGAIKDKVDDRFEQIGTALEEAGIDYECRAIKSRMSIFSRLDTLNWHLCSMDNVVRLRFNPKCRWTIESTRGVTWNDRGRGESDKVDIQFRKRCLEGDVPPGLIGKDIDPVPLTHLQAALGYWLQLEFPQIQWAEPTRWHSEPDGTIVEFHDNRIIEKKPLGALGFDLESFNPSKHSIDQILAREEQMIQMERENQTEYFDQLTQENFYGW